MFYLTLVVDLTFNMPKSVMKTHLLSLIKSDLRPMRLMKAMTTLRLKNVTSVLKTLT